MTRRPKPHPHKAADTIEKHVLPGLRPRLEAARLDLLALFRALDSLRLVQSQPPELRAILELDADIAEALAVLDRPPSGLNLPAMVRDTLASLDEIAAARQEFVDTLHPADRDRLAVRIQVVRATLDPREAYNQIPGRDPRAR
jgi:hypothetical protein